MPEEAGAGKQTIPKTAPTSGDLVSALVAARKIAEQCAMPEVAALIDAARLKANAIAFARYRDDAQRAEWALRRTQGAGG